MKTLFSRILFAQVVAVVLALTVVILITRASLNQGFEAFLQRQENMMLQTIAPALTQLYERQGGWDLIRQNPDNWQKIWRVTRLGSGGPQAGAQRQGPGPGRGRPRDAEPPGPGAGLEPELRWMAQSGRGKLRDRLFLLDEVKAPIAGHPIDVSETLELEAIVVDGEAVGWIGFAPTGSALPHDAQRFMEGQLKIMFLALAAALAVAVVLAWVLARNVSRPVQRIGRTVRELSDGRFEARSGDVSGSEVGTLAMHVNRLAASLEKSRTARQRWMADIAHELRTPVAVMKGEIEAIADGVRTADERTTASLNEEIDHLASMVEDLQTLALADAGALNVHKEAVNLTELVRLSTDSFRNRLAERNIELETDLGDTLTLNVDAQRIRQLLHNLLENSGRYVEEGGKVRLSLEAGRGAVLMLEDSGPGVSEQQLGRLFDRFYRAEGSRSRSTGGSGLGLSICRNIVEAHGGTIEAGHSALGGLSIRMELPE
jgi:two-component system sensor histidine kinase BaeS